MEDSESEEVDVVMLQLPPRSWCWLTGWGDYNSWTSKTHVRDKHVLTLVKKDMDATCWFSGNRCLGLELPLGLGSLIVIKSCLQATTGLDYDDLVTTTENGSN